ncbi:hypothetical protein [Dyadobacter tibetensis]|uniref:hypothetical protein n=1 Tax=Dyadobacter tibetensis TaxID=1211851 RepID=UPI0004B4F633|nr:hypothetical protein [Dyadobacter tibetensis]
MTEICSEAAVGQPVFLYAVNAQFVILPDKFTAFNDHILYKLLILNFINPDSFSII